MKTCPVCNSIAFDDATMCFGCLHEFGKDLEPAPPGFSQADPGRLLFLPAAPQPPEFLIRLTPAQDPSGAISWACSVDLAPNP